jgi:EAL domain-containing protein (putative c-di-GMP-specific phosphodiesterase class I)
VELERPGLVESLGELRSFAPNVHLVLEIHESAPAKTEFIHWLRTKLGAINVGLAYDNFGAGQARLMEFAEVPPHYLKFSNRYVRGVDQAPLARRRLVQSMVATASGLLVMTVAQGIETAGEARACAEIGFTHGQGFHLGPPRAIEEITRLTVQRR